ncbi:MAG: hypothetical protein H0W65_06375 [Sphingomonas sp.]|uniref:hypothetical protein n=1 Tax=Sphingomonas sp. TaxID=28214 RepID=UPI00182020BC|nr:hypothetical protein [Sphingomonas sp.]MBA3667330.1 hypothetical protein [Sphingomonas sp.]
MTRINFSAAAKAGIIAGIVFMTLEMVLVATVGGESPWGPPRMIAAIAMGKGVLPPPATFDLTIFLVAMLVHFTLSILIGIVFAMIADMARWSLTASAIAGLGLGLAIYAFHFYGMTAVFPWFAMARGAVSIFAHAMYGLVLGYAYRAMAPLGERVTEVERTA